MQLLFVQIAAITHGNNSTVKICFTPYVGRPPLKSKKFGGSFWRFCESSIIFIKFFGYQKSSTSISQHSLTQIMKGTITVYPTSNFFPGFRITDPIFGTLVMVTGVFGHADSEYCIHFTIWGMCDSEALLLWCCQYLPRLKNLKNKKD